MSTNIPAWDAFYRSANTGTATITGQIVWDGKPVIDDDDGGTAGVREPRRPVTSPPSTAAALTLTTV